MENEPPDSRGFLSTLKGLGDALIGTLHDRIELVAVELQEEKLRLIQIFVWISAAVFAGMMFVTFASITVVYLFWESARLAVLGGLTVFYALVLAGIIIAFRRYLASQPLPFPDTRQELSEDRECIRQKI